jgi:hypothetical protein
MSPRLRHILIQKSQRTSDHVPPPTLVSSSRECSPSCSPDPSYISLHEKTSPLSPINSGMGDRPSQSIFGLLNALVVESPPSSAGSISPRNNTDELDKTVPVQRIPLPLMSAPISSSHRLAFFPRDHRPSVDMPQPLVHRPDMLRRHSSHPYELNPATNRLIYREFDFSPVGSRTPISRTTKACNACRSRKVRCDAGGHNGEAGICSRCREAGIECVYTGLQRKRGPCPGMSRSGPSVPRQRPAQRAGTPPPDLSPARDSASSYDLPSTDPDPQYFPPNTPTYHSYFPPYSSQPYDEPPPSRSGWTSSQPRPLPPPSAHSRQPSSPSAPPQLSRKPSFVSWQPSEMPEERSRMFEQEYSMQAQADDSIEAEEWRGGNRYKGRHALSPILASAPSAFGGDGRSLPPLRVMLGDGWNHYQPPRNL